MRLLLVLVLVMVMVMTTHVGIKVLIFELFLLQNLVSPYNKQNSSLATTVLKSTTAELDVVYSCDDSLLWACWENQISMPGPGTEGWLESV